MAGRSGFQPLVLSWSGTVSQLFAGAIQGSELEGALFYFGCTKGHAFEPEVGDGLNELQMITGENLERGKAVHRQLMEMVRQAEAHDRVAWRTLHEHHTYERLNELLERCGLPTISLVGERIASQISLPQVCRLIDEQGLPYRIIGVPEQG